MRGGLELSTEDTHEPTRSTEFVELSSAGEVQGQQVPIEEGTFEIVT